ncbi:hypothetical protein [Salaquimonas pukyongi]|uniref:hypothetical protein n=1 Tax=Salaquimonas pukyongi TaxID=2712698 RepID=UPI00096BA206|nr:hypothetical protein [Salaquimonas pukyongi]
MAGMSKLHVPFRSVRSKAEVKADVTNRTARAIIDDEVKRRKAKTEKLRKARLSGETQKVTDTPPGKNKGAKAGKRIQRTPVSESRTNGRKPQ